MKTLIARAVAGAIAGAMLLSPLPGAAQSGDATSRPVRGSAQRIAILNAIRPAVEAELGPPVEFVVTCLQVENGWALVNAQPQRRGGRPIDPHVLSDWEYRDGLTVTAVLRFQHRRWNVTGHAIGATDVWYDGQVPRSLQRQPCSR